MIANTPATISDDTPGWPVIPAATLIIFRHGAQDGAPPELLFVQRAAQMRFAGGATVFPGGRIDPADHALAEAMAGETGIAPAGLAPRIAAIRETLEETGLAVGLTAPHTSRITAAQAAEARHLCLAAGALAPVLTQMGWRLAPQALVPFARWCPHWDGAFDTHFYLANIGTGAVDIAVDGTENARAFWMSAADALVQADAGAISVIFPTRRNLERLARFNSFAEAEAQARAIAVRRITPLAVQVEGAEWLTIPDGLGYPVLGEPMSGVRRD